MESEITSILITGCFWYWTTSKISITISPLREENRWHRRVSNLAFTLLTLLQLVSLVTSGPVMLWLVSTSSAVVVVYILRLAKFEKEGFWAKPRNQVVGSIALFAVAGVSPLVVALDTALPMVFAVILAHAFHQAHILVFATSIRDLDSLRAKVSKLEADLHNAYIRRDVASEVADGGVLFHGAFEPQPELSSEAQQQSS